MLKSFTYAAAILGISFSVHTNAIAACTSHPNHITNPTSILVGNTVCASDTQEQHYGNGDLVDYKGGSDPGDPTTKIGTWSVSGSEVTYSYFSGSGSVTDFTFELYVDDVSNPTSYCFVGPSTVIATIKIGFVACN